MHNTLFMILRRMRAPLIFLIISHAISILGMTLVPGVDAAGKPAPPMDFFHAFYVVTYTATTIGFGELPGAFSEAQRVWITVVIYMTVTVWLYSIGSILKPAAGSGAVARGPGTTVLPPGSSICASLFT